MVVGAALQASSFSLGQLIAARWITGFGNGMNTSTVPMWQSETSKPHRRGQLVMIEGSLIVFGVMLSYWIDFGFSFLEPSSISWRFPIAFQIVLALIILAGIPGLPESPRWLILKGRNEEALVVLAALADRPADDPVVQDEFKTVNETVFEMSRGGFRDCFKRNKNRNFHRTVLAYVNQMFQQISGINILTYYIATLFQRLDLGDELSRLLAAVNGTEYWLASLIAIFTIEKFGRRSLMLFGAVGQAACMYVLAGVNSPWDSQTKAEAVVAVVCLFLFNTFFAVGWLGMTWLYPAEVTPLSIRAPATAIATTANWIFNFMVVMITPPAFTNITWRTYLLFAVINTFMVPCVYLFFPETTGRSLEEMDEIFQEARGVRGALDVVRIAHERPHRWGKNGELLIAYDETNTAERRRSSIARAHMGEATHMAPSIDEEQKTEK